MIDHRHVVIGFQGSGKTTFAAALWYLVDSRAPEVPTALSKGRHTGDYKYLEAIAAAWESGWQVKRTGLGTWQSVKINLKSDAVEDEIELSFVDMSGETFEQVFTSREYDSRVEEMAHSCDGLLLFVSADRKVDDVTLVDVGTAFPEEMPDEVDETDEDDPLDELEAGGVAATAKEKVDQSSEQDQRSSGGVAAQDAQAGALAAPKKPTEFTPADTPRQVQIVDILDAFADNPIDLKPTRIAVVVSAWDLVAEGTTPDAWLSQRMALLDQYLKTHADVFETRIYGVSAQGGRLPKREKPDEESDRAELLKEKVASRRIRIVGHGAGAHDLTHPIAWLSGLER